MLKFHQLTNSSIRVVPWGCSNSSRSLGFDIIYSCPTSPRPSTSVKLPWHVPEGCRASSMHGKLINYRHCHMTSRSCVTVEAYLFINKQKKIHSYHYHLYLQPKALRVIKLHLSKNPLSINGDNPPTSTGPDTRGQWAVAAPFP